MSYLLRGRYTTSVSNGFGKTGDDLLRSPPDNDVLVSGSIV